MNYADELDIILEQDQHLAHAVAANPKATNFLEFLGQQADFTAGMLRYLNQFPEIHQQLEDLQSVSPTLKTAAEQVAMQMSYQQERDSGDEAPVTIN